MRGDAPSHDDPGLQPERTSLSWLRTGAVLGAVVLVFMRLAPGPGPVVATIGLVCLVPVLAVLLASRAGHRARVRGLVAGRAPYFWWRNVAITATVVVLALASAILMLTSH
ncbi:DUF202 domain-containing protein [Rhodococcus sp. Z13]|uniref:DUF202 domain-containing protein n=1 Tax=Rhodococcus sacchari TaxID=2962047 RepID=A0ACD4DM14_9NOCA|nr:DUF202 domain-containing protein [Rhodococcus sp. Z13]UYP21074.1 DUF202 domain-containing protein [Rhodococcus sp. Z13]